MIRDVIAERQKNKSLEMHIPEVYFEEAQEEIMRCALFANVIAVRRKHKS